MSEILNSPKWRLASLLYIGFAIYMLGPLGIVAAMSFKNAQIMGFPITEWTTQWYEALLTDREFVSALTLSIYIAVCSTAIALVIGIWAAVALTRTRGVVRVVLFALVCLPAVVPGTVAAISLRIYIQAFGWSPGPLAVLLAHAIHSVPYVALMALTRLNSMPKGLTEAARDLGADNFIAFLRVTIPFLMPALIGGAIFSFLSSFDDFIRSFFLGSFSPTLPVLIFNRLFLGVSPALAAISTLVLVVTIALGLYAETLSRKLR